MDRRRVLLIVAVVVALLGAALVFVYVKGADQRAAEKFEGVPVLKATVVIQEGESIDDAAAAGKIVEGEVPAADLLGNAQTSIEPLTGKVALTTIYPGEQIVADKFGAEQDVSAVPTALPIPKGNVAITVSLTDTGRVAGFVSPGSQVAIFHSTDGTTQLLLPKITVVGIGSTTPGTPAAPADPNVPADPNAPAAETPQNTEDLPRTLLTLSVNQVQAQKIISAGAPTQFSSLVFALLTPDSDIAPIPPTTPANLFR